MSKKLWNDCNGGVMTTELLLISSVVVGGLLTGLGTFRANVESEFQHLGERVKQSTQMVEVTTTTENSIESRTDRREEGSGIELDATDLAEFMGHRRN